MKRESDFLALFWTLFAFVTILFSTRLYVVQTRHSRFRSDDYALLVAYICLATLGGLYTVTLPAYIEWQDWQAGKNVPEPPESELVYIRNMNAAQGFMLITEEWLVKLSFLFFLRRVVKRLPNKWWMRFWWANIGLWAVTLVESYAFNVVSGRTTPRPENIKMLKTLTLVQAVSNIAGDVAIVLYPFPLVSRLKKITTKQRIGLYALFSLCAITITACIMRLVSLDQQINQLRAWVWLTIECQVALAVGTIPGIIPSFGKHNSSSDSRSNDAAAIAPSDLPAHGYVEPIENRRSRRLPRNWMDISISMDRTRQGSVAIPPADILSGDVAPTLQDREEKDLEKAMDVEMKLEIFQSTSDELQLESSREIEKGPEDHNQSITKR